MLTSTNVYIGSFRKFEIEPLSANPLNVRPANSVTMSLNYAQFSTHMDIEDVYRAFTKRDCERNSDYLRLAIAVSTVSYL